MPWHLDVQQHDVRLVGGKHLDRFNGRARLHHLAWNHTGCRHLRFRSTLAVGPYVRRCARHTLLTVLSLGLYRPWASVDAWRLRTEALAVRSRVDPRVLAAHWSPDARGTADGR